MKESNLPKPIFINEREDFVVTLYNGEYPEFYPEELKKGSKKGSKKTVDEEQLLNLCKIEKSLKEIAQYFDYKDIYKFKNKYLNPLLNSGRLKMTIPEQPKNRNQKYISVK